MSRRLSKCIFAYAEIFPMRYYQLIKIEIKPNVHVCTRFGYLPEDVLLLLYFIAYEGIHSVPALCGRAEFYTVGYDIQPTPIQHMPDIVPVA